MKKFIEMKSLLFTVMILIMSVSLVFVACDDDDDDKPAEGGDIVIEDGGVLSGTYSDGQTVRVSEDFTVTMSGLVLFNEGSKLVVEKGATLKGDTAQLGYIVIGKGATIDAQGTAEKPITFTSGNPEGSRRPGDWGGIVINGKAPINAGTGEADGEGDSGKYGGTAADDNSGTLKYVRIWFAGHPFSSTNELNGLCLQGVGSGTVIENIQMHAGADDGVEMFGGTVSLKNIVSTGNMDDQIDCTFGWQGSIENAVAVALPGCDSAFEYDNNEDGYDLTPRTTVSHTNVLVVGTSKQTEVNAKGETVYDTDGVTPLKVGGKGARMRRGAYATFTNSYFTGITESNDHVYPEHAQSKITLVNCNHQNVPSGGLGYNDTKAGQIDTTGGYSASATTLDLTEFADYASLEAAGADAFVTSGVGAVTDASNNWAKGWTAFPAK